MTEFNNNINTDYYALWYYTIRGERSANAISLDQNALWGLHTNAVNDKECMFHQYKKSIFRIEVKQIQCYIYNSNDKTIEELTELNNDISEKEGAFYAMYNYPFITKNTSSCSEVLIYLTKEEHELWRSLRDAENIFYTKDSLYPEFFYTESISHSEVIPDVYYEEGIMNA